MNWRYGENLLEEFGDDGFDFFFAVFVAVDDLHEFAFLVFGDDAVAFEFGFFNFLGAIAIADDDVAEGDFLSLCLFEIIHDDLNLVTHGSSVEVVVGERWFLGLGGFFSLGRGSVLSGGGMDQ